jgi:hypothetical protein
MKKPTVRLLFLPIALVACASPSSDATAGGDDAAAPGDSTSGGREAASNQEGASDREGGLDAGDAAAVRADGSTEAGSAADGASDVAAAPSCAGLLCEDFEQGQLDPTKWDLQAGAAGTSSIETQTVAHGKYAMQVHGSGSASDFALILTKAAPASLRGSGPAFGRAYLFTDSTIRSVHTELLFAGTEGFPELNYMEVAE